MKNTANLKIPLTPEVHIEYFVKITQQSAWTVTPKLKSFTPIIYYPKKKLEGKLN